MSRALTPSPDGVPLRIDAAAYSPFGEAQLVVELAGRWLTAPAATELSEPAQLVLEAEGETHTFPEIASEPDSERVADDVYTRSFVVPAPFEEQLGRSRLLFAGGRTVAVPPAVWTMVRAQPDDPGLVALRAELRERVATETRLRRTIAELRAQLEARGHNQDRLEATQAELRESFAQLRERLEQEIRRTGELQSAHGSLRADNERLEAELAAATVARDSAAGEVDELRSELDTLGAEYAISREPVSEDEIDDAEALLAEARALTARLQTAA
ncbi:MAG TPA: hypothetical protein VG223_11910 [Solirubrobacteraceae bacterium]|nr:hypothetical protein [Solirubrobacteraceae bacterium]